MRIRMSDSEGTLLGGAPPEDSDYQPDLVARRVSMQGKQAGFFAHESATQDQFRVIEVSFTGGTTRRPDSE